MKGFRFPRFNFLLAGFVNGWNVELECRWSDGNRLGRLGESAGQLVDWKAELIVAIGVKRKFLTGVVTVSA